jgi:hypothetical protein
MGKGFRGRDLVCLTPENPISGLNVAARPIISDSAVYDPHLVHMSRTTDVQKSNVVFHLCAEMMGLQHIGNFRQLKS